VVVNVFRVVTILVIAKALFRLFVGSSRGISELLYGRWPGPIWLEAVVAVLAFVCLWKSGSRGAAGVLANVIPALFVLVQTVLSPESYTALFWIPRGGPTEPWGVPRYFTYEYRYANHQQLVSACVLAMAKNVFLTAAVVRLVVSRPARKYFAPVKSGAHPSPGQASGG
jgi:hypothetical protein